MSTDQFAREAAQHAHRRIRELGQQLARHEKLAARRAKFDHRCHLCGDPCAKTTRYCHAHSWAEGT